MIWLNKGISFKIILEFMMSVSGSLPDVETDIIVSCNGTLLIISKRNARKMTQNQLRHSNSGTLTEVDG